MKLKKSNSIVIIFFLLIFNYLNTNSQTTPDPKTYSSISDQNRIPLFTDDFSDNKNNWVLGIKENEWFQNLQDGTLFFQSYKDVAKEDFKNVVIDQAKDFEMELKIRLDKGIQNKFNGLQWGKSSKGQFDFFFNGQGQYTIDKFTGTFTDIVPITSTKLINNYTYNTLTVRKIGTMYYFFLNKQLVNSAPFEPFFGNGIGFQVGEKSSVQIDYLKVWQIKTSDSEKLPMLVITGQNFSTPSGTAAVGTPISLKIKIKNESTVDANNIKLLYKLPGDIMLLESKTDLQIKAGDEKETEIVFYINKTYPTLNVDVKLKLEGATFADTAKIFNLALNQPTTSKEPIITENYALYRSSSDPLKGLNAAKAMNEVTVGRYFGLIIGADNYAGTWPKLKNAVNDAKAIESELSSRYEFQSLHTLYNEQATRANIMKEFEWLMANIKETDNLLIFYSGHGEYKENIQKGFWVPIDATDGSISSLISNTDIQAFLSGIKSKHTFLIADACFSGDIFRGKALTIPYENSFKYYNQTYSKQSRKAMTSGGIEPVMDGGKDGHSVFSYYLLKSLRNNENKFFDASQLYNDLKIAVVNNSNQTPGFNAIVNTGDEGGNFIFVKK